MPLVRIATVRRALIFVVPLALTLLAVAALPARAANQSVTITGFAFSPATVNANVGDTVTWTNNEAGGVPHTVSSDTAGVFDSGNLNNGQTFNRTFTAAGTIAYHCNVHPGMMGTVVVAAAAAVTPAPGATAAPPAVGTGLAGEPSTLPLMVLMGGMAVVVSASAFTVAVVRARPR